MSIEEKVFNKLFEEADNDLHPFSTFTEEELEEAVKAKIITKSEKENIVATYTSKKEKKERKMEGGD